jgi:hypothetical protein
MGDFGGEEIAACPTRRFGNSASEFAALAVLVDIAADRQAGMFLETAENLNFDPHSLEGLNRVFAVEINRLTRGPLAALTDETERQRMRSRPSSCGSAPTSVQLSDGV